MNPDEMKKKFEDYNANLERLLVGDPPPVDFEQYGTPRMLPVLKRLTNVGIAVQANADAYWKAVNYYEAGLRRYLAIKGIWAEPIEDDVKPDFIVGDQQ